MDTQQAATKRAEGKDHPGGLPARWADKGSPVAADDRPELSPAIAPLLAKIALDESIPVTYTTRSGEVFTTLKPLRPMPSLVLSHHPEAPTHNVAMVGFPQLGADLIRTLALNEGAARSESSALGPHALFSSLDVNFESAQSRHGAQQRFGAAPPGSNRVAALQRLTSAWRWRPARSTGALSRARTAGCFVTFIVEDNADRMKVTALSFERIEAIARA